MKKILSLLTACILSLGLSACDSKKDTSTAEKNTATKVEEKAKQEVKSIIPNEIHESGKGKVFISTPSGTSENGNVPVLFASKNTALTQISFTANEFDGSKLTYILIDGKINEKNQLATSQGTLTLSKEILTEGKHKVEFVQFDNDNTDGKIITYKSASFEVKIK